MSAFRKTGFLKLTRNHFILLLSLLCLGLFTGATEHFVHPKYTEPVPVVGPPRIREWKYIVVHHSGSSVGNEDIIQSDHLRRGMENGMAYHFLIGNGSAHLGDGAIVEAHRWKHKLQGGHCHQDFLNECGIGICLVGNFSRKSPTQAQVKTLANLILKLQQQYHISDDNVHGHGQFFGEDSDCPGNHFPWTNVWQTLNIIYEDSVTSTNMNNAVSSR
jgi:N-acetyl-anhydromuramyl-L-alanine amidase AmpD